MVLYFTPIFMTQRHGIWSRTLLVARQETRPYTFIVNRSWDIHTSAPRRRKAVHPLRSPHDFAYLVKALQSEGRPRHPPELRQVANRTTRDHQQGRRQMCVARQDSEPWHKRSQQAKTEFPRDDD